MQIERKSFFCIVFSSTRCNVDSRVCVGLANLCRFALSTDFGSPQFWQNSKVAITSLPHEWSCHERKLCSNDPITCFSLSIKSEHLMDRSVRVGSVLKDIEQTGAAIIFVSCLVPCPLIVSFGLGLEPLAAAFRNGILVTPAALWRPRRRCAAYICEN